MFWRSLTLQAATAAAACTPLVSPQSWNCHTHSFDPAAHPFKPSRSYTPEPAPLSALCANARTDHILLVQASIEDGPAGLMDNLEHAKAICPGTTFRGAVFADTDAGRELERLTPADFDRMHALGVRNIRIRAPSDNNATNARVQFERAAALDPVHRLGWSLSAQLPLIVWAGLAADIAAPDGPLAGVTVVADHCGSATPADLGSADLEAFAGLLAQGRLNVKIGALHRRSPGAIDRMEGVVRRFAEAGPENIVWGSDWPHVNSSAHGPEPSPPITGVDTDAELRYLRAWLSEKQWRNMMVENPAALFGH